MRSDLPALRALSLVLLLAACDEPGSGSGPAPDASNDSVSETTQLDDAEVTPDTDEGDTIVAETIAETIAPDTSAPACIDELYDEALPDDRADITALIAGYNSSEYLAFTDAVLTARYPHGASLVRRANAAGAGGPGNCITAFTSNRSSARNLIGDLSTVVHECGHIFDLDGGSFSSDRYVISPDVTTTCDRGDTTTRGGDTFARSRMNGDVFGPANADDFYKSVYLDGDPDDARFDGGDQGFNSVLEEATQYVNSLATDWALRDQQSFTISSRDGILTFLWYIERYLHMARNDFPQAYQRISGDACWRSAILNVWGRAWLYLDLTESISQLGINDAAIERLVLSGELIAEIDRIRALQCP